MSKQIGLRGPNDRKGPRIHDLRHSFAVNTVIHWYRTGQNIDSLMPRLSAYMGHQKPTDTYWYLTGVPELMAMAKDKLAHYLGQGAKSCEQI